MLNGNMSPVSMFPACVLCWTFAVLLSAPPFPHGDETGGIEEEGLLGCDFNYLECLSQDSLPASSLCAVSPLIESAIPNSKKPL